MSSPRLSTSETVNPKRDSSPIISQPEDSNNNKVSDSSASAVRRSMNVLTQRQYTQFDHNALLVEYEDDYQKDTTFEADFTARMMDLLLETRAWALARPRLETERHGLLLLEEIKSIQAAEAEQDRVRQGLVQFVHNIKLALAALANLV